jgi:hypothetical protein
VCGEQVLMRLAVQPILRDWKQPRVQCRWPMVAFQYPYKPPQEHPMGWIVLMSRKTRVSVSEDGCLLSQNASSAYHS